MICIKYNEAVHYRIHQPIVTAAQRHPRRWIAAGIFAVVSVIVIVKILTAPAHGHIVAVDHTVTTKRAVSAKPAPASTLDNQYFSLHLPVGYRLNSSQTTAADSLLNAIIFKSSSFGTSIITIAIVKSPEGGWQELSSYRARQQAPANYGITTQVIAGDTVGIVTRLDGTDGEVTAFWPHGALVATLAISRRCKARVKPTPIEQA